MRYALMIAAIFLIATVAVASLEPFAPKLPAVPQDATSTGQDDQAADTGGDEAGYDESEDNSDLPTASPGRYDEAAQDRGK